MTVRSLSSLLRTRDPANLRRVLARVLAFAALGVCAALLEYSNVPLFVILPA